MHTSTLCKGTANILTPSLSKAATTLHSMKEMRNYLKEDCIFAEMRQEYFCHLLRLFKY